MIKWRSLREDPPQKDCKVCVKIGTDYEVYDFEKFSEVGWGLNRGNQVYDMIQVPKHAVYINLNEILLEVGLQD